MNYRFCYAFKPLQVQLWAIDLQTVFQITSILQSIQSTMNELYPVVEQVLKNYSEEALLQLISQLTAKQGDVAPAFDCPANYQYVLKRFIAAALARDPTIKFNAYTVLSILAQQLPKINGETLFRFISVQTNHKKHCGGKSSEIEAYIIGKLLIIKSLRLVLAGNLEVTTHLIELLKDFPEYEEQIIELLSLISTDKKSLSLFSKLNPTTKSGFLLFKILQSKLKKSVLQLNEAVIDDVLAEVVSQYPRRSICLTYVGPELINFIQSPADYLEKKLAKAFGSEEQELNIKYLFYALQLIEGHLRTTEVTSQNVWKVINVKLLSGWLLQLKVKNKHTRKLAEDITIKIQASQQLAIQILKQLHQKQLYLDNINSKHPLFSLYQTVEPNYFANYLYDICSQQPKQVQGQQEEEEKQNLPFNQLQFFIVLRQKQLKIQDIAKIINLFINRYQKSKDQNKLQAVNTILNAILHHNTKKAVLLNSRSSLILSKLDFGVLELGESSGEIKQTIKDIRLKFKELKDSKDAFMVSYWNFILAFSYYTLIYPQQIEIYGELQMVEKDLKTNILFSQNGQPKKKTKLNSQADKKKPIHVLIDIFISLLTKSPQFLRTAINSIFEQLIPYVDSEDISHLLQVIQKPDHEYIEEENQQQKDD